MENVIQLLKCSRNTVFSDLKSVKEQLKAYGLELRIDLKNGYGIEGKTFNERAVLLCFLKQLLDEANYHALPLLDTASVDDYYGRLQKVSSEREHEYRQDSILSTACILSIIRDLPGQYDFSLMELRDLCEAQELDLINRYLQELNVHERLYLTLHPSGSETGRELYPQDDEHNIRILGLSSRLVEAFEHTACVSFNDESDSINPTYMHLKPPVYYNRFSIQVVDLLIDEMQEQYKDTYIIIQLVCEDLRGLLQMSIIGSGITYLTMHFGGHLKQGVHYYDETHILIVRPSGISTSMLLRREIEGLYANMRVADAASLEHVQRYEQQVDSAVSTTDVQSEVPIIRVRPILSREDKAQIASMMMSDFDCYEANDEKLSGLFSIIASHVEETDMDALKRDVLAYLNRGSPFVDIHNKEQLGLLDMLRKEDIQVLEQVDSWKEIIQTASALLLSHGVIQNSCVQEMIHLVGEYGPYILLANSVTVAHAEPEHGAFRLGLSLLICHEDIYLDEVSAVWYLLVLSNAVRDKHSNVLREILQLSRSSTLLAQLGACTSAVEVRKILLHAFS